MSHLHIPDGLLPVWLWLGGLLLALAAMTFAGIMVRRMDMRRKIPLLGMMSAMMLVGMNLEIIPIAYHVNLSIITAIVLGPWLMVIASFIVCLLMSLVGHGGITVVGLNTLVIATEGCMGYLLFTLLRRLMTPGRAAGAAAFGALFISTCMMLAIVFLGSVDLNVDAAEGMREILETPTVRTVQDMFSLQAGFNFRFFMYAALGMGALGWTIEAFVTSAAIRFISRVKPDMLA